MIDVSTQLQTLREFQKVCPNSYVGGSIGLFLHGKDLQRDLGDLDITTSDYNKLPDIIGSVNSSSLDFTYCFMSKCKIDVRINYLLAFDLIEFEGYRYRVAKVDEILFWKTLYANNGSRKHIDDLHTLETGIRPNSVDESSDDLPF